MADGRALNPRAVPFSFGGEDAVFVTPRRACPPLRELVARREAFTAERRQRPRISAAASLAVKAALVKFAGSAGGAGSTIPGLALSPLRDAVLRPAPAVSAFVAADLLAVPVEIDVFSYSDRLRLGGYPRRVFLETYNRNSLAAGSEAEWITEAHDLEEWKFSSAAVYNEPASLRLYLEDPLRRVPGRLITSAAAAALVHCSTEAFLYLSDFIEERADFIRTAVGKIERSVYKNNKRARLQARLLRAFSEGSLRAFSEGSLRAFSEGSLRTNTGE